MCESCGWGIEPQSAVATLPRPMLPCTLPMQRRRIWTSQWKLPLPHERKKTYSKRSAHTPTRFPSVDWYLSVSSSIWRPDRRPLSTPCLLTPVWNPSPGRLVMTTPRVKRVRWKCSIQPTTV